jgi:Tat protein secretion system quality control protein TatD with DNase activity
MKRVKNENKKIHSKELCVTLSFTKNHNMMHGQQNVKILKNLVAWLTRRLELAHPYSKVVPEVVIHPLTVNKQKNSELSFIVIVLTRLEMSTERNPSTR